VEIQNRVPHHAGNRRKKSLRTTRKKPKRAKIIFVSAVAASVRPPSRIAGNPRFYCAHAACWWSYNAAERARGLGYTHVGWYRGGLVDWENYEGPMVTTSDDKW